MAGLSLRVSGNVGASAAPAPYSTADNPTTIPEAAFGSGAASAAPSSGLGALMPDNAAGIAFWSGVAGVAFLMFIRHSLPR